MNLTTLSTIKIDAVKKYGSKKLFYLVTHIYEAYKFAVKYSKDNNFSFVHPYDDLDVIAGQGTIGVELLSQLPKH